MSSIRLYQGKIFIQFEMQSGDSFVVRFADDGKNGGKRKVFDNFVDDGQNNVGKIDHGSMPDDVDIKISNN